MLIIIFVCLCKNSSNKMNRQSNNYMYKDKLIKDSCQIFWLFLLLMSLLTQKYISLLFLSFSLWNSLRQQSQLKFDGSFHCIFYFFYLFLCFFVFRCVFFFAFSHGIFTKTHWKIKKTNLKITFTVMKVTVIFWKD